MGIISDCLHFKIKLKTKIYLYDNSTTQKCPNKTFQTFLFEDFFNDTSGAPGAANIYANFTKHLKRSYWDSLGLGETD
jgi:hypothetical protein